MNELKRNITPLRKASIPEGVDHAIAAIILLEPNAPEVCPAVIHHMR